MLCGMFWEKRNGIHISNLARINRSWLILNIATDPFLCPSALMVVSVLIYLFWPVSVPLFLVYDFTFVQKGKWYLIYLNSFIRFLWISAITFVLLCCAFVISKVHKKSLVDFLDELLSRAWKGANISGFQSILRWNLRLYFGSILPTIRVGILWNRAGLIG